jgi:crossover junction endodeoxyribonuclease RuvC
MKNKIVGIDPGNAGAIVIRSIPDGEIETIVMPTISGQVNAEALAETFLEIASEVKHVYIEEIFAMSKAGAFSMLNFGKGHGKIIGVLAALRIPYTLVAPKTWQKAILGNGPAGTSKKRAINVARRLFPHVEQRSSARAKNPHSGIVDALLIAEYGVRHG